MIHQTHYEKSDWWRAFNQFTIACELAMINAISAADIAFMPGYQAPWSVLPRNRMAECLLLPIVKKMYNKTIIEFGFHMIS